MFEVLKLVSKKTDGKMIIVKSEIEDTDEVNTEDEIRSS